jgi:hypothetical protein
MGTTDVQEEDEVVKEFLLVVRDFSTFSVVSSNNNLPSSYVSAANVIYVDVDMFKTLSESHYLAVMVINFFIIY